MKLQKFKERNNKQKSIMIFTIACILLITGVFLYKTFAIYKTNMNQDMINGEIQDIGDIRFMVYVDDVLQKEVPKKEEGYSLDTSSSYCDNGSIVSWNDERWSVEVKNISTTKTKCYLKFKKIYQEGILNGAIPDLMNGRLVPVVISENTKPSDITYEGAQGGKVTKADITDDINPWYSYANKRWANAVILRDGVTDHYKPGDEIKEEDIESYFVWIPRYRYQLKDNEADLNKYTGVTVLGNYENVQNVYEAMKATNVVGNKGSNNAFEIIFETKEKGNISNNTKGEWLTHPAFTSFSSNGFWVGKFETGYKDAKNASEAGNAEFTNKIDISKVIIKPNVYSWRSINVSNAFYTSYEYQREIESHMMKNSEWGAVAYLTQSKYGRCNEVNGKTICEEVRINNNQNYITGYSAKNTPTCGLTGTNEECNIYERTELGKDGNDTYNYFNSSSVISSTTGNYTGIYDMVGGAFDYVMGVLQTSDSNKNPTSGRSQKYNSGFNGTYSCYHCDNTTDETLTEGLEWPSSKYYDLYDYNTSHQEYQRGKLGDATKEMGPFYNVSYLKPSDKTYGPARYVSSYNADLADFVYSDFPWFVRGGTLLDGTNAGVFSFLSVYGQGNVDRSFRIILTP